MSRSSKAPQLDLFGAKPTPSPAKEPVKAPSIPPPPPVPPKSMAAKAYVAPKAPRGSYPPPPDQSRTTLLAARIWLQEGKERGVVCPCCDQYAKIYKRKFNSSMARGLITLARYASTHPQEEWFHLATIFRDAKVCASNDGALLRHWGLIAPFKGQRKDGSKRVGYHRLTDLGKSFARGIGTIPAYAVLYSEELLRLSEEQVTMKAALGAKFSFEELMGGQ